MKTNRLQYFDILKGIAIFMVVMGHVLTMGVREIDRATLFKFIGAIHMPLFFFISGWFTYKVVPETGRLRIPDIGKRALQLLVPMVVVSTLWIWYFPHSGLQSPLTAVWPDTWKAGYWFPLVLFQIILIYTAITPVISRLSNIWASLAFVFVLWWAMNFGVSYLPADVIGYGSFDLTTAYFGTFVLGVLASKYREGFARLTSSGTAVGISILVGAVLLYMVCWYWEFDVMTAGYGLDAMFTGLFHVALAVVAIAVVAPWSARAYAEDARPLTRCIADVWSLLGRKSLAIYLLHYFFLFPLTACRPALEAMNLAFVPLFWFAALIAAAIIAVVLGADAIIARSPALAFVLTGDMKIFKRKKS